MYEQVGGKKGIEQISTIIYSKIYSDFSLNIYFKDINFDDQVR
jgi:hypothetical protein